MLIYFFGLRKYGSAAMDAFYRIVTPDFREVTGGNRQIPESAMQARLAATRAYKNYVRFAGKNFFTTLTTASTMAPAITPATPSSKVGTTAESGEPKPFEKSSIQ